MVGCWGKEKESKERKERVKTLEKEVIFISKRQNSKSGQKILEYFEAIMAYYTVKATMQIPLPATEGLIKRQTSHLIQIFLDILFQKNSLIKHYKFQKKIK